MAASRQSPASQVDNLVHLGHTQLMAHFAQPTGQHLTPRLTVGQR
eukprot:CAMPEP_0181170482 /NCGR_PEP_ID=MMETSP1096-20121128/1389_1 /TAXON_ID=156174 ORGANISM="Chrysochromulina ericina, Strain CCMP281" /NCGR_SAMPLE_ID=MMETSP1096 /ASSEMBLY_ACC=CAM_ASM_000453 /LENGTH=44 /DNA_ID= /DNA_START= /DNA_END= /DNA_ORIENTATION=